METKMTKDLQSRLMELLSDPRAAALQADLARAAVLRQQEVVLRQRAGAAVARLRAAEEEGADRAELEALKARTERRLGRLAATTGEADAADVRRPHSTEGQAQIFGRARGEVEKPPLTAAAISADGEVLAHSAVKRGGVFHLTAKGSLEEVRLQLSDKAGEVVYRSPEPVTIEAGSILQVDVAIGEPRPKSGPVPGKHRMPDLIGQSEEVALAVLERLGVRATIRHRDGEGTPGVVIGQVPEAGKTLKGTAKAALTVRQAAKGRRSPRAAASKVRGARKRRPPNKPTRA